MCQFCSTALLPFPRICCPPRNWPCFGPKAFNFPEFRHESILQVRSKSVNYIITIHFQREQLSENLAQNSSGEKVAIKLSKDDHAAIQELFGEKCRLH
jgi:hypothetical protein